MQIYLLKRATLIAVALVITFHASSAVATDLATWKKQAEEGDLKSQWVLGKGYVTGEGVQLDLSMAAYWFRKAANQSSSQSGDWRYRIDSTLALALMNLHGVGVPRNYTEAARLLQLVTERDVTRRGRFGGEELFIGKYSRHSDYLLEEMKRQGLIER